MIKRKHFILLLVFGLIFSVFLLEAHAGGVVTNCDYFGDKITPGTLAWALEGGGDVIFECSGEVTVPKIVIGADTFIDANGYDVILSGGNTNIVLTVGEGLTLDLKGLKITKAKTPYTYGAIESRGGTVNLNDCLLYGNEAIGLYNYGGIMTVNRCSILANTKWGVLINEGTATIIDCVIAENAQNGIRNLDGIVMVDGCTISGNSGSGAGIENSRGKMTVINTIVSENKADTWESASAGGIRNGGDLTVIDSEVKRNIANNLGGGISNAGTGSINFINTIVSDNSSVSDGGGIFNNGTITFLNSNVSGNIAGELDENVNGGGIANYHGSVSLINTVVSNNFAPQRGGGIHSYGGTVAIENSTISNNYSGGWGGGINSSVDTTMTITNSTISGNTAVDHSGGINNFNNKEPLVITNSTISGNTASMGGGIRNDAPLTLNQVTLYGNRASEGSNILTSNIITEIANSVIAGGIESENCACTSTQVITDGGYNLDDDGTCNLTHETSLPNTYAGLDTLLVDNGGFTKTHALLTDSPAIDGIPVGTNGCGDTVVSDQRGAFRPQGDGCDIGAYELAVAPDNQSPVVSNVQVQPNPDSVNSEIILTGTIDDSQTGNSHIGSAQYNLNGGEWKSMYPTDAIFNDPIEEVFAMFSPTGSSHAPHEICVRGGDVFDNISESFCMICYLDQAPFLCMRKPSILRLMRAGINSNCSRIIGLGCR